MSLLVEFLDAQLMIGGVPILWREIVGNVFGLAAAIGGMRRVVWAWPVGIVGNLTLLTVFLGGVFHTPQDVDLYGQAGRQVMFLAVGVYGWWQWSSTRRSNEAAAAAHGGPVADAPAVGPHWATGRQRAGLVIGMVTGTLVFGWIFAQLGSWGPWADAWIFTGSILATYGMARGWTEFWLLWIGVDIVGVPLLLKAGYYPSAALYLVYGAFVIWGFLVWWRVDLAERADAAGPAGQRREQLPVG
ncbi:nicotinamide mononucleotide transporter [Dietzia kunjamensis]|uniref:nicotinamide mononucleotide transporter family protein n=1 Tax=Dietzia kunjamensis TaxID=322509 RepID=UPI000E7535DD|nr:nicotinamide mononucleotide transporter family protein [Dietzia kunjamensis]MVZ91649.1 nicotinamide riboside transporter PnuC [Microbacter sp. ANSKLAB05]RKE62391.1 nicotinamide mononucleotide transporter [Dietzia kunjamensis]